MNSSQTAQKILSRLESPIIEFRFLLDRGYKRTHALRFVGEHHQLESTHRNVLERVVFPEEEARKRKKHLVSAKDLSGQDIVIDGFNILISLDCLKTQAPLFLADDGVYRDIAARKGIKNLQTIRENLTMLCELFSTLGVNQVLFIFDQQVSRSGEIAALTRAVIKETALVGQGITEPQTDRAVINASEKAVVCSSDRVIIDGSPRVFDAISYFVVLESR